MKLVVWSALLFACGASRQASVTIAASSASASSAHAPATACPTDFAHVTMAQCTQGQVCRYPEITCICRMVPYCPGGVVREGPPPPPESLQLECLHPDCVGAVEGATCSNDGLACRAAACYSRLTCAAGHWKLVQLGPPP